MKFAPPVAMADMSGLVTSLRMYNVVPRAKAAWQALFERVFADVGIRVSFLDHDFPKPIDTLWQEPALCADFMCGWPFVRSHRGMQAIVAPVPSSPRYAGLPRYCSEFLAREESGWGSLEETFGHRIGWMASDSQSGFNAPRAALARHVTPERRALYREARGPFFTPARTLQALRSSEVDVVALDSFLLDLIRHHAPEMLAGMRTVATTPWMPITLLVAAPGVHEGTVQRLGAHLVAIHEIASYRPLLAEVILDRFVQPDLASYVALEAMAHFAQERGYQEIR